MKKLQPSRKFCLGLLIVCVLLLGIYHLCFADALAQSDWMKSLLSDDDYRPAILNTLVMDAVGSIVFLCMTLYMGYRVFAPFRKPALRNALFVLPALAAEGIFIPSMGYELKSVTVGGKDVTEYFVNSTVPEAKEGTTDIAQEERDQLIAAYEALGLGDAELPVEGDYIFEDMSAISVLADCDNAELLAALENGEEITVVLDPNLEKVDNLVAYVYVNGAWEKVEKFTVNNDGTVTCVLKELGPIVFATAEGVAEEEETEDETAAEEPAKSEFVESITYKQGP
ncbi:MAG: hypothetical protein IKZ16_00895, partial [Clostridia bacterium]|nr:hypothetical protein [Clostridia bacterium]